MIDPIYYENMKSLQRVIEQAEKAAKRREIWLLFNSPPAYGNDLPHLIYYTEYVEANRDKYIRLI